jgi:pyruvate dehydrogenase E2 component (dihydrolipoamide acetyltransferase)
MATFFAMPKLGLNMVEGRIVNWLVKEGAKVRAGEPILEIETDKATNEVESPVNGVLSKIMHKEGENVPCNGVLAVLLDEGESLPSSIPEMVGEEVAPRIEVQKEKAENTMVGKQSATSESGDGRIIISPSAKKLAKELGIDINRVIPSGNQIRREDVERAYQDMHEGSSSVLPDASDVVKKAFAGIRKITGEHMAVSVHTTARVALSLEVHAGKMMQRRKDLESSIGKVSYNVLLAEAAAKALSEFPYMNSRLEGEEIWEMKHSNIGIAVDTERGLLVPVIRNADQKSIETLHEEFAAMADRAVNGKATQQDLEGGTFTITNLGAFEIENFVPVINLPECAILAVGTIMPKAVAENGMIAALPMMNLTLVFDHRIVDGAGAAKFLQRIKHLLEA